MKVLVADPVAEEALDRLRQEVEVTATEISKEELLARIGEFEALIVRSRTRVTEAVLDRARTLRIVARAGVGIDNIDLPAATARGVLVVNAPTGSTQSVAELAVAMMLSLARRLPEADRSVKAGRWEKSRLKGAELSGKVLGLIGSGRIGGRVAQICRGFGMQVLAYDPYLPKDVAAEREIRLTSLEEVLREGDVISIHAALTEETEHLVGAPQLALMKPSAFLVNCARGAIVDEAALSHALEANQIAGAGLDVYEVEPPGKSPLRAFPNVVLTPHIGAATREAQRRTGLVAVEQVLQALRGERPEFLLNPEVLA